MITSLNINNGFIMKNNVFPLHKFLRSNGLRVTAPRKAIFDYFMKQGSHLSPEELYNELRKKFGKLGRATVYRTLKLLKDAELAVQVEFADGSRKFEHTQGKPHHDHMICEKCGKTTEFIDTRIEKLQQEAAKKHGFLIRRHFLQIFGICRNCKNILSDKL